MGYRIDRIKITNFRCFREYTISLSPHTTVLYGLNGAGKTTLIKAIQKALSFMMYSDVKDKKKGIVDTITAGNPKLRVNGFDAKRDFYLGDDAFQTGSLISIEANGIYEDCPMDWSISTYAGKGRLRGSGFKDTFRIFYSRYKETNNLPVLAYYSDGFPHVEDKKTITEKMASLKNFAYYDWDNEAACSRNWIERLERKLKRSERLMRRIAEYEKRTEDSSTAISNERTYLSEVAELEGIMVEINAIQECFKQFSSEDSVINVQSLELSTFDDRLCVVTRDGKSYSFRDLPAGYKRMYYILLDIAYRSFILNGHTDAWGVVVLDEIDLHLHPSLEKVVLTRFRKVFRDLQLIVSTHSPLVITNLQTKDTDNIIYCMKAGTVEPVKLHDVYGLDYNSGLEDVMDVSSSNEEISNMVSLYAYMKSKGLNEEAANVREQMISSLHLSEENIEAMANTYLRGLGDAVH